MPLDFEKVKTLSLVDLAALALCEFSRFTDAVERIAPDVSTSGTAIGSSCPHPVELRIDRSAMGQPKGHEFICGVCQALVRGGEVIA